MRVAGERRRIAADPSWPWPRPPEEPTYRWSIAVRHWYYVDGARKWAAGDPSSVVVLAATQDEVTAKVNEMFGAKMLTAPDWHHNPRREQWSHTWELKSVEEVSHG